MNHWNRRSKELDEQKFERILELRVSDNLTRNVLVISADFAKPNFREFLHERLDMIIDRLLKVDYPATAKKGN